MNHVVVDTGVASFLFKEAPNRRSPTIQRLSAYSAYLVPDSTCAESPSAPAPLRERAATSAALVPAEIYSRTISAGNGLR